MKSGERALTRAQQDALDVTAALTLRRGTPMAHDTDDTTEDAPKKVSVTALKYHTNEGKEYQEGDEYEVDASKVDNLVANGMAKLSE